MKKRLGYGLTGVIAATLALSAAPAMASSHREAPQTTEMPKVDNTDVYAFRSYAPGREAYTTLISNFQPFQEPGGGPNYFTFDPDAIYEIHIDNDGNAAEDITFQFRFFNTLRGGVGITLPIGAVPAQPIALRHIGQITDPDDAQQGEQENYSITMITGDRRTGTRASVTFPNSTIATFRKPVDNIGNKTTPNYAAYAAQFVYDVTIPGCPMPGRVFVGQREEAFAVNIGPIFDLVNFVPIEGADNPSGGGAFPGGITQSEANQGLKGKYNTTSLALEVPTTCLRRSAEQPIIGVWSTASLPQARLRDPTPTYAAPALDGGAFVQVSRLGMPLVNELVIGLPQKDLFNAAEPTQDGALASYVTNPTLPAILDALFRAPVNATLGTSFTNLAPTNFPRADLVATFLTGINGLNRPANVVASEMQRLNTAVPFTPLAQQNSLGVLGNDLAGFPNGRRPGDDVVDIELRVAMGRLCHPVLLGSTVTALNLCGGDNAPTGLVNYTDGAPTSARTLQPTFPYLNSPLRGSPRPEISQN